MGVREGLNWNTLFPFLFSRCNVMKFNHTIHMLWDAKQDRPTQTTTRISNQITTFFKLLAITILSVLKLLNYYFKFGQNRISVINLWKMFFADDHDRYDPVFLSIWNIFTSSSKLCTNAKSKIAIVYGGWLKKAFLFFSWFSKQHHVIVFATATITYLITLSRQSV